MKRLHSFALYALLTPAISLGAGSVLAEQSTDYDSDRQSTQRNQNAGQYGEHPAVESTQRDQGAGHMTTDSDKGTKLDEHPAMESNQQGQDARQSTSRTTQSDQQRAGDYDSDPAYDPDTHYTGSGTHPALESSQRGPDQESIHDQGTHISKDSGSHPALESAQHDQSRMQNRGYMNAAPANGAQVSNLIGANVTTTGGEEVGPVNDLIIDENGQVVAIVVGVGGFLGIGQRNVAIGWDDVTRSSAHDDEQELRIDSTRESLRSAPEFESRN